MADTRTLNPAQKQIVQRLATSLVDLLLEDQTAEMKNEYRPGVRALLEMLVHDVKDAEVSDG